MIGKIFVTGFHGKGKEEDGQQGIDGWYHGIMEAMDRGEGWQRRTGMIETSGVWDVRNGMIKIVNISQKNK